MHVFTIFQVSLYLLLSLSSLMLAYAEAREFSPQMLTPLFACVAFVVTERKQIFSISAPVAAVVGFLSFLLAWGELSSGNIEARILSGAHLIVYLSWIVIFQKKEARQYWMICALAILQAAVGSVLTHEGWFGVGLVALLMLAMWTLSVFSLHQAQQRFSRVEQFGTGAFRFQKKQSPAQPGLQGLLDQSSQTRGAVQQDPNEKWINLRFIGGYFGTAVCALLLAGIFFMFIPRLWIGQGTFFGNDSDLFGAISTGFASEIELGALGEILESTELALRIRLIDERTDKPADLMKFCADWGYDEPMFRGNVMGVYEQGKWKSSYPDSEFYEIPPQSPPPWIPTIRQEIEVQPMGSPTLFAIYPIHTYPIQSCQILGNHGRVEVNKVTGLLKSFRDKNRKNEPLQYRVYSPSQPSKTGRPVEIIPSIVRSRRDWRLRLQAMETYLSVPDNLESLKKKAAEIVHPDPEARKPSPREKIERLVHYLRDSGEYGYTLSMAVKDASIDPVEDFLLNRKEGHCEYYASALALMLRSVDVPARLISGFKGAVVSKRDEHQYEVQQRHAHAWVEAQINGQWVTLDATPGAARTASVESIADNVSFWERFSQSAHELWRDSVVGLSFSQQKKRYYEPVKNEVVAWWNSFKDDRNMLLGFYKRLKKFLTSPDQWFSWQGGVVTFVFCFLVVGLVWLGKRVFRFLKWVFGFQKLETHLQQITVEFFERFRKVCQAHELTRQPSETPREFVQKVEGILTPLLQEAGLGEFPPQFAEAFYSVRFGGHTLDEKQLQQFDQQLTWLEEHWAVV